MEWSYCWGALSSILGATSSSLGGGENKGKELIRATPTGMRRTFYYIPPVGFGVACIWGPGCAFKTLFLDLNLVCTPTLTPPRIRCDWFIPSMSLQFTNPFDTFTPKSLEVSGSDLPPHLPLPSRMNECMDEWMNGLGARNSKLLC